MKTKGKAAKALEIVHTKVVNKNISRTPSLKLGVRPRDSSINDTIWVMITASPNSIKPLVPVKKAINVGMYMKSAIFDNTNPRTNKIGR